MRTARSAAVSVTPVAIPSGVGTSYGITTKRIYRAATGNTGTVYRFVAEIPLATADYVDVLTDAQLGEVLESEDWDLPPDDLRGILALPNGVMVGFSKNQLCLSAQNHPHAWPIIYRLNVDTDIVGLGNVDTTVVIGTESFVYVASGSDPAAYSMNKFEVPQAASSKNSFAYLAGIGVTFAGPDGLMAVAGVGQVRNLTDSVFTREQWQALNPTSMHAVSHNDIYWLFWQSGSNSGCYAIDMKPTGFGVVTGWSALWGAAASPAGATSFVARNQATSPSSALVITSSSSSRRTATAWRRPSTTTATAPAPTSSAPATTPPATQTGILSTITCLAAVAIAIRPEAHWRSIDMPATVTGRPARRPAVRPIVACTPCWSVM